MNVLRLRDEADGLFVEVPYVDGHSLVALVEAFEALLGYDEPGTYAGLPRDRAFDPDGWLPQRRGWPGRRSWGTAVVLACACGEVGCWPLTVRISAQGGLVVWDRFEQPRRPDRDYTLLRVLHFRRGPVRPHPPRAPRRVTADGAHRVLRRCRSEPRRPTPVAHWMEGAVRYHRLSGPGGA